MTMRFRRTARLLAVMIFLSLLGLTTTSAPADAATKGKTYKLWTVVSGGDTKPDDGGLAGTAPATGDLRYVFGHVPSLSGTIRFDLSKLTPDPTTGMVRIVLAKPLALPNNTNKLVMDGLSQGRKAEACTTDGTTSPIIIDGGGQTTSLNIGRGSKVRFLTFANFGGYALSASTSSIVECVHVGGDSFDEADMNGGGIEMFGSKGALRRSVIKNSRTNGVKLSGVSKLTLANNTIVGNGGSGIYVNQTRTSTIVANVIGENGDSGIKMDAGAVLNIIGLNDFTANTPAGITLGDLSTGAASANTIGFPAATVRNLANQFFDNGLEPSAAALAKIESTYHVRSPRARGTAKPADDSTIGGGVVIMNGSKNTVRGNSFPCGANCAIANANRGLDIDLAPTAGYNAVGSGGPNNSPVRATITKAVCIYSAALAASSCVIAGKSANQTIVDFYANGFYIGNVKVSKTGTFNAKFKTKTTANADAPHSGDVLVGVTTLLTGSAYGSTGEPSDPILITDK